LASVSAGRAGTPLHQLQDCRTAALGGFALECDPCSDCPFLSHACRDRHGPRCQRRAFKDGHLARITAAEVERVLNVLMQPEWAVYSKPCLARTDTVIEYFGRYRHRIALSDRRQLNFDAEDNTVDVRY
jgi:hypothetical protein